MVQAEYCQLKHIGGSECGKKIKEGYLKRRQILAK